MNENKDYYLPLIQAAKEARQAKGISVIALSRKLGWTRGAVYRIEQGKIDVKTSTLMKYLDACGYSLAIEQPDNEPYQLQKKIDNLSNDINQVSEQLKSLQEQRQALEYQMLARLRSDCEYSLNTGENKLWARNAQEQIDKMRELYNGLEVKPEWITLKDIDEYEKRFNEVDSEIDKSDDIDI